MSLLHLGQLQLEVRHRPFAGMMILPVGEQDTADIQKHVDDCSHFLLRLFFRRSNHRCHRIRAKMKNCQHETTCPLCWALWIIPVMRGRTLLCVATLPEPVPRDAFAREVEVLHLRVDEMICNVRHDIRESAVRDDRNFLDSLKMLLEEPQVSKQRAKVFPARKRFCAYQYSAQRPMFLKINIDLARSDVKSAASSGPSGFSTSIPSSRRNSWLSIGYPPLGNGANIPRTANIHNLVFNRARTYLILDTAEASDYTSGECPLRKGGSVRYRTQDAHRRRSGVQLRLGTLYRLRWKHPWPGYLRFVCADEGGWAALRLRARSHCYRSQGTSGASRYEEVRLVCARMRALCFRPPGCCSILLVYSWLVVHGFFALRTPVYIQHFVCKG